MCGEKLQGLVANSVPEKDQGMCSIGRSISSTLHFSQVEHSLTSQHKTPIKDNTVECLHMWWRISWCDGFDDQQYQIAPSSAAL